MSSFGLQRYLFACGTHKLTHTGTHKRIHKFKKLSKSHVNFNNYRVVDLFIHLCLCICTTFVCLCVVRPEVGTSFHHSLPVPFEEGYPPESGFEFFSARLETRKPSDPSISTYLGAGGIGIAGITGLIHGCWNPHSSPHDWSAHALSF